MTTFLIIEDKTMKQLIASLVLVLGLTACGGGGGGSSNPPPAPANRAPVANFTVACTDLDCTFTNSSTDSDGTVASSSWDFGDNAVSTEASPNHTYTASGTYSVRLTVTDDDGATGLKTTSVTVTRPELSIANASVVEGDEGTTIMNFIVTLSKTSSSEVTVKYNTTSDTATVGEDFIATSGTLTFTPGQTSKPIAVPVNGDILYADEDPTETFIMTLSDGSVPITDATGVGTIETDDMSKSEAYEDLYQKWQVRRTEYRNNMLEGQNWENPNQINIDLDNDGDKDILMTAQAGNDHANEVTVIQESTIFRNMLGKGFVSETTDFSVQGRDFDVRDYNGDGLEDIIIGDYGYDFAPYPGGQDQLIIQNSDGTLSAVTMRGIIYIRCKIRGGICLQKEISIF